MDTSLRWYDDMGKASAWQRRQSVFFSYFNRPPKIVVFVVIAVQTVLAVFRPYVAMMLYSTH